MSGSLRILTAGDRPIGSARARHKRVLVTAGYGHQGQLLIPKLAAAGYIVRAVRARAGGEADLFALGAHEVLIADLSVEENYVFALQDVDVLFHVGPAASPIERTTGEVMIEAAKKVGTRHVVLSSVLHTIIDIAQHRIKRDIEEELIKSGLAFTIMKPCDFLMPEHYIAPAVKSATLPCYWNYQDGRRGSLISLDDLTDAVANVIIEGEKHYFASYELSGPDKLTVQDQAAILGRLLGKTITPVAIDPDAWMGEVFGGVYDDNEYERSIVRSISKWYSSHDFIGNPNTLNWLLGRPAATFEQTIGRALARL